MTLFRGLGFPLSGKEGPQLRKGLHFSTELRGFPEVPDVDLNSRVQQVFFLWGWEGLNPLLKLVIRFQLPQTEKASQSYCSMQWEYCILGQQLGYIPRSLCRSHSSMQSS